MGEKLWNHQDEIKNKLKEVLTIKELQKKEQEHVDSDYEGELQGLLLQDWKVKGVLLQDFKDPTFLILSAIA